MTIRLYKAPTGQIIYYHGKADLTERGLQHIGNIKGFNVSITTQDRREELMSWTQYKRQQQGTNTWEKGITKA